MLTKLHLYNSCWLGFGFVQNLAHLNCLRPNLLIGINLVDLWDLGQQVASPQSLIICWVVETTYQIADLVGWCGLTNAMLICWAET